MKAAYGKGQAPTNWELEVSADGETGWVPVDSFRRCKLERK